MQPDGLRDVLPGMIGWPRACAMSAPGQRRGSLALCQSSPPAPDRGTAFGPRRARNADEPMSVAPPMLQGKRQQHGGEAQPFQILEVGSLSTLRQMVARGAGVTILPATSVTPSEPTHSMLEFRPFSGVTPRRDIVLVSRRNFPRPAALVALVGCLQRSELPGVTWSGAAGKPRDRAKPDQGTR